MAKNYYIEDNEVVPAVIYAETQPIGYTLITDSVKLLELTMADYTIRQEDGIVFYNTFRSKLLLKIKAGEIQPIEAFTVEAYLKDLKDNLITGNWMTAQNICTNLALSGIFDQVLKDEILTGITNYVNANY